MSWFKRKPNPPVAARQPHAYPRPDNDLVAVPFRCTTCGRTDLPEAGDWDPPICLECDAAINEDAILEEVGQEGQR
jgi:hypothetical protein